MSANQYYDGMSGEQVATSFNNNDTRLDQVIASNLNKESKQTGKSLSTNDFDDTAKNKLAAIPSDVQAQINAKMSSTEKGTAGGVTPLGGDLKVAAQYLPSYVDDVLEYTTLAGFPNPGETGKIYIATGTNKQYRWSGSSYIEIVPSPGTTDAVTEGATNLYFTPARVRSTALTGLTPDNSGAEISATDTILSAFRKVVGYFTALGQALANKANLTDGVVSLSNRPILGLSDFFVNSGTEVAPMLNFNEDNVTAFVQAIIDAQGGSPADPATNPVVDNDANTFNWTNPAVAMDQETRDGGATWVALTAKPIVVGDVNKGVNTVGVRKGASGGNPASPGLYNNVAFTATPVDPGENYLPGFSPIVVDTTDGFLTSQTFSYPEPGILQSSENFDLYVTSPYLWPLGVSVAFKVLPEGNDVYVGSTNYELFGSYSGLLYSDESGTRTGASGDRAPATPQLEVGDWGVMTRVAPYGVGGRVNFEFYKVTPAGVSTKLAIEEAFYYDGRTNIGVQIGSSNKRLGYWQASSLSKV